MQLNSLSLNSSKKLKVELAIYDHKMAILQQEIFIFGRNFKNNYPQTSLYKFNTQSFSLSRLHIHNTPTFQHFIMFSSLSILYFWGKKTSSTLNQLYSFDGDKFNQLDQNGAFPQVQFGYAYCVFSEHYLMLFGYIHQHQYIASWYILNLKTRTWKQAKSDISLPFSQKSTLLWKNGKAYLFLIEVFDTINKSYRKNCLYEITLKYFSELLLKCQQILIDNKILTQNINLEHFFSFNDQNLIIMSKQQSDKKKLAIQNTIKQTNSTHQQIFILNLETFEWSSHPLSIKLIGENGQIIVYKDIFFHVGGIHNDKLIEQMQILYYNCLEQTITQNRHQSQLYEQSRCYNCEQAFTYTQNLIYQPYLSQEFDNYSMKVKAQMKFYRKLALQFVSQFQAIGLLIDYFKLNKCRQIILSLREQMPHSKQSSLYQRAIQKQVSSVFCIEGVSEKFFSIQQMKMIFSSQQNKEYERSNRYVQFSKFIMASFKIGMGVLFVTFVEEAKIFVGYVSCSSIQFPEINVKSFSGIYYTIYLKASCGQNQFSSILNRSIVFRNVSLYFQNPEVYQKVDFFNKVNKNKSGSFPQYIYIIETSNIQKTLKIQQFSLYSYEDMMLKNRKQNEPLNSLQKYLRHLYLTEYSTLKIQNSSLRFRNIYDVYRRWQKNNFINPIIFREDKLIKNQYDQTHFSTGHDETLSWKKIDEVQKCKLYSINSNKIQQIEKYYQGVFVYHQNRLVKTVNIKKKAICGIVQMGKHIQIMITGANFSQKCQQRKLLKWLDQIQSYFVSSQRNCQD